jgi:hypothetical protein
VADADDEGGEAACRLHELCPTCGAVPSPDSPGRCWRCGTADALPPAGDRAAAGDDAGSGSGQG